MFHSGEKKEVIKEVKEKAQKLNESQKRVVDKSKSLLVERNILRDEITIIWNNLNKLRNTPEKLDVTIQNIKIEYGKYDDLLNSVHIDSESNAEFVAGGSVAAGVAAGAAVTAVAPTALMAIATTFGTASTGAAISGLGGAAATNAALAWLGGGALTAGGAGIAGGSALLALSGPLGLAIGGTAAVGSALFLNHKNKKVIDKAYDHIISIDKGIKTCQGTMREIDELLETTTNAKNDIKKANGSFISYGNDYSQMDDNQKYSLGVIINNTYAAVKLLNKAIGR